MAADVVDWEVARAVGIRVSPKGPVVSRQRADEVVASLREHAVAAVLPVEECTGLSAPADAPPAMVVDRAGWVTSNVESFRFVLSPVLDRVRLGVDEPGSVARAGSRLTAMQLGAVLGWMSGRVLGQYEALVPAGSQPRLLLVAPNILRVADELGVDERDFQLWVCLHEQTHRTQFTAVPWLADHFATEVRSLVAATDVPVAEYLGRLGAIVRALMKAMRGVGGSTDVLKAAMSTGQRETFDRLMVLMTLVEGHADVIMDEVGPEVVPTVGKIREAFDRRRAHPGPVDSVARRFLGLDAKMRQYSEGAVFVRSVMDRVGMSGLNEVWREPANLPTQLEIDDPAAWVRRVHG